MSSDLTFITNEPGKTLVERFNVLLRSNTRFFEKNISDSPFRAVWIFAVGSKQIIFRHSVSADNIG